ncbi:hypothetical protein THOM_0239, partial [Trachipleistophora hominis]
VHPVSPSDVVGLTMLICKTMMGFMGLRERVTSSHMVGPEGHELDLGITGPKFRRDTFITDIEVFAGLFSLTMPFPEPERVKCFNKHIDRSLFVKKFDSSRCEVDMQALVLYIDDFYTACRVTSSLCKYALGFISLCMRPEYGDFGSILSDSPTSLFVELEKFKATGMGSAPACALREPSDFLLWYDRLCSLRALFVNYLTTRNGRFRGLVEMCRIAKEVEKDIEKLESEYNAYLDSQEGFVQDYFRTWGLVGGRGPLFIHSVPMIDVYQACTDKFKNKVNSLVARDDSPVVALMQNLRENGGVLPPDLVERRERFWEWQKKIKKEQKPMRVPINDLLLEFQSEDSGAFVFERQMTFMNLHQAIIERVARCWLNSSLYNDDQSMCNMQ